MAAAFVRKKLSDAGFGLMAEKGFESRIVTGFICESEHEKNGTQEFLCGKDFSIASGKGKYSSIGLRIGTMGFFDEEKLRELVECIADAKNRPLERRIS